MHASKYKKKTTVGMEFYLHFLNDELLFNETQSDQQNSKPEKKNDDQLRIIPFYQNEKDCNHNLLKFYVPQGFRNLKTLCCEISIQNMQ